MSLPPDPPPRKFDLEERTEKFSRDVRRFVKGIPKRFENVEDLKQRIRSSGSVAANYIEAHEFELMFGAIFRKNI